MAHRLFTWRLALVGIASVGAAAFVGYSLTHQTMAPVRAEIQAATRKSTSDTLNRVDSHAGFVAGNGLVEPQNEETKVGGELAGRISVVSVIEGQKITAGDIVVELEHSVDQALVDAAAAEAEAADAELSRVKHGLRGQEVSAIVAESRAARARRDNAASELQRNEELAKSGSVSTAELDRARRNADAERAGYEAADARASAARTGSRYEDVMIALARQKAAHARVDYAEAALGLKVIRSPIDGEVLRVRVKVGEFYNPLANQPLVLVGDTSKLRVRVDIDERDLANLRIGAPAYVTATPFGAERFDGKVLSVARRLGRRTVRTDEPTDRIDVKILEVVVDVHESRKLVPGLRVTGFIEVGQR